MNPRSAVPTSPPVRSMSHAPESIRPSSRASVPRPEWILCRNLDEFPIPDQGALLRWTEQGRIRRTDYLVNPRLDTCVQAKDMADLQVIFRKTPWHRLGKLSRALALGGCAVVWMAPLVGSLMLLTAIAAALLYLKESSS